MRSPPADRPPPPVEPPPSAPVADAHFTGLYQDLRRLARARLRRSEGVTLLDTTSLVHESWLRLRRLDAADLPGGEGQFLAYASRVMRLVVIDFVRQRRAERRGGDQLHVTLSTEVADAVAVSDEQVLGIHEALEALAQVDPRLVRIVEMRCFGGLDEQTIAQSLGVTDRTVRRDWQKARLLLKAQLLS
ncbi:sigma-70 family RNA polymerase sigma factor [Ideonella sp. 4Y16]|uniref:Sigma-70 family RNA polymerase sigma factor n=1 Tax=Ideonella alba TaxID=2824118 RepID=A0A941BLP9_9BURK|nr:ECF-type sigma factor [Ideonella alba]MBQ0931429.1 sigma-70 family RNA polymerase sigma factor [Ideonella alba]MBQ0944982.1 sigma-70 family RNA polymerase sigma factor [Ideonella alba]